MNVLNFTRPTSLYGLALEREIAAAGFRDVRVSDAPEGLLVEAYTAAGEPVTDADRPLIQTVIDQHSGSASVEEQDELNLAVGVRDDLAGVRAKARAVYRGTDTFTAAQVQRLVAALVLMVTRRG